LHSKSILLMLSLIDENSLSDIVESIIWIIVMKLSNHFIF
jgi:hypothetical protein